jgi:hypothetical protein
MLQSQRSRPKITGRTDNPASITFCLVEHVNDQRNRAAAVDVDFKFRVIRRSGSPICSSKPLARRGGYSIANGCPNLLLSRFATRSVKTYNASSGYSTSQLVNPCPGPPWELAYCIAEPLRAGDRRFLTHRFEHRLRRLARYQETK